MDNMRNFKTLIQFLIVLYQIDLDQYVTMSNWFNAADMAERERDILQKLTRPIQTFSNFDSA